tara:strand:+ start:7494 stop:7772 length:279 start_codon:yes stop_codon:yes gene_type:complete
MGKIKQQILKSAQDALNHYSDETSNEQTKRVIGKQVDEQKNKDIEGGKEQKAGAVGTIRVVFDGKNPIVEIKSAKGWITSDSSSATGFIIKK